MGRLASDLAVRLTAFNDEVISFVQGCGGEDWEKVCAWEKWSVGTTARHIGAGHYSAIELGKMIVKGQKLPHLTMEEIINTANRDAREHEKCTKDEVLEILKRNGQTMVDFVEGLEDSDLDRTGYLSVLDKQISLQQFMETIVLQGGGQHFKNIRTAVNG